MEPIPFEAWPPAYGVWAIEMSSFIRLLVHDSGGRGSPHVAVIVRVEQNGDRLRLLDRSGKPLGEFDGQGLFDASIFLSYSCDVHGVSPYFFDVPIADWPKDDTTKILILLLYLQARGIGGRTRPVNIYRQEGKFPDAAQHGDEVALANEVANAVAHALKHDTIADMRGGLITGTITKDQPDIVDREKYVSVAVASCLYPADIFDRMPDDEFATQSPADASLLALNDILVASGAPTLLLFAGDQVYVDATAGLFDPKVKDGRYRVPYERRAQSRGVQAVMQQASPRVEMILDDHEIRDNWAPNDPIDLEFGDKRAIELGKAAYFKYQRALKRPLRNAWHKFEHEGLPVFIGDTRTERDGRSVFNWRSAAIMSTTQFNEVCDWLTTPRYAALPKFILTGSALLPRTIGVSEYPASALHSDRWDGYPHSLYSLLKFACENEIKGLIFMSGDDHLSNVVRATVTRQDGLKQCVLHSVHSSPLYAPYPFANSMPENFIANEVFTFCDPVNPSGPEYACEVETRFLPGDGFAVVRASRAEQWTADVQFFACNGELKGPKSELADFKR
jgi:hypothetical protein